MTSNRRSRRRLVALAALAGAAVASLQHPAVLAKASEHAGPKTMVTLVDSFASGPDRSIQEALNAMIRSVADAPEQAYSDAARYVDVYGPSAGHTACDLPAIRWVEPIVPVNAAAPVHPNLGGMTAIKEILLDEVWPKGLPRRDTLPGLPAPPDSPL